MEKSKNIAKYCIFKAKPAKGQIVHKSTSNIYIYIHIYIYIYVKIET